MSTRILSLGLAAILTSGCVALKTRKEIREEGGDLEKQTQTQRREEARTRTAEKPPPPAPKGEELDEQMRQLNGRVDTAENQVQQLNAAVAAEKESVTNMAKAIDQKFLSYEEAIKKLEQQVATLTEQVNAKPAASSGGGSSGAPKGRSAYEEAEESFAAKKWKEAIVNYQKYRDSNPKGKQYADATYKIGICFQELKMKDEAKAFYDEVISKFPRSKEAKKAAFRSKQLK